MFAIYVMFVMYVSKESLIQGLPTCSAYSLGVELHVVLLCCCVAVLLCCVRGVTKRVRDRSSRRRSRSFGGTMHTCKPSRTALPSPWSTRTTSALTRRDTDAGGWAGERVQTSSCSMQMSVSCSMHTSVVYPQRARISGRRERARGGRSGGVEVRMLATGRRRGDACLFRPSSDLGRMMR